MKRFSSKRAMSNNYIFHPVRDDLEAKRVSEFLLGEDCFDDQRFTPGELIALRLFPMRSLQDAHVFCRYTEEAGIIIAAMIFIENEHLNGGYRLEYFGVHRNQRHRGLGQQMIDLMFTYCRNHNGRYIETSTSDLPEYEQARMLFIRNGFEYMCHLPDYYNPGEGKMIYYLSF